MVNKLFTPLLLPGPCIEDWREDHPIGNATAWPAAPGEGQVSRRPGAGGAFDEISPPAPVEDHSSFSSSTRRLSNSISSSSVTGRQPGPKCRAGA
jgi:hypothetical protein